MSFPRLFRLFLGSLIFSIIATLACAEQVEIPLTGWSVCGPYRETPDVNISVGYDSETGEDVLTVTSPSGIRYGIYYPRYNLNINKPNFSIDIKSSRYFSLYCVVKDTNNTSRFIFFLPYGNSVMKIGRHIFIRMGGGYRNGTWQTITQNLDELLYDNFGTHLQSVNRFYIHGSRYSFCNLILADDTTPPQNPGIIIKEGDTTDVRNINLTLYAEDAYEMRVSEDSGFSGVSWEPYATSQEFTLSEGLGNKSVFAQFRDYYGNESAIVGAGIKLVSRIMIEGRQLIVNGSPHVIKGVTYQPTPIDWGPWIDWWTNNVYTSANCDRDFALLRDMGCNTVRTYGKVNSTLLTKAEEYGIMVCAGFWVDYGVDLSDPAVRTSLIEQFSAYVAQFKDYQDYPAVLMWVIGNEQNYVNGSNPDWYSLANEMARAGHQVEGDNFHPVAISNGDLLFIGSIDMMADDDSLDAVDIWGVNVYRGRSFGSFFDYYASLSGKPLLVSECGIDVYDNVNGVEYQEMQAEWDVNMWDEIAANNDICTGVTFMSYSDEWWKANGRWDTHDSGGFAINTDVSPDGFFNEEWWGIVAVSPDGPDPDTIDDVIPRQVYYALQVKWTE